MSEWKKFKLGEIIDDIAMGPFGSNLKVDNFISEGVPVIRGQNLNEGEFKNEKNFVFVSEEKAQSLKRCLAYEDDLVFTHRGTIGQVGIIPKTRFEKYLVSQSQLRLTVNKKYLVAKYLFYFFKSHLGQHELLKNASQVGVPAIATPTKSIKEIDINIPDIKTQKQISDILSSLDDKIELNRQMNQTLEQIAQTLFKEWFVNNEETEFVKITEYVEFNPKLSIKKGDEAKYIEMSELSNENLSVNSFVLKKFVGGSKFQNNDTLFARITPCLENGKTGYVDFLAENEIGFGSTEFIVMRAKDKISPFYVYCLARFDEFRNCAIQSMVGSSGRQRVQNDMIAEFEIKKIDLNQMEIFNKTIEPIIEQILENHQQTRILTQLRDSFLPKLMNGEVEV